MTDKNILDQIIDSLEGSCDDLSSICEYHNISYDNLTIEDLEYIDDKIFQCSNCGWWYETGTQDEDNNCEDCQEEDKDE